MILPDAYISSFLPCAVVEDDHYHPNIAGPLLQGLYKLDDESAAVSVRLWAVEAEQVLERN